jgi:hypothetical protein
LNEYPKHELISQTCNPWSPRLNLNQKAQFQLI